jgi:hypothetical protein
MERTMQRTSAHQRGFDLGHRGLIAFCVMEQMAIESGP